MDTASVALRQALGLEGETTMPASLASKDVLSACKASAYSVMQSRNLSSLPTSGRFGLAKWLNTSQLLGNCKAVTRPSMAERALSRGGGKASGTLHNTGHTCQRRASRLLLFRHSRGGTIFGTASISNQKVAILLGTITELGFGRCFRCPHSPPI